MNNWEPTAVPEVIRYHVSSSLRSAVAGFIGYREYSTDPFLRHHVPNITPLLFIGFGVPLRILSPTGPPRSVSSILQMAPAGGCLTGHGGWEHGIQVNLTPTGAYQLTGIPMREVTGRCLSLDEVWGAWAHWLE